jgi:hypothetical protein
MKKMKISVEKSTLGKTVFVIAIFTLVNSYFYGHVPTTNDLQNLTVEIYPTSTPIKVGNHTVLQVLVYDEDLLPKEGINVHIKLVSGKETIHLKPVYLGNGLYETSVQFFQWGSWEGSIQINKGRQQFEEAISLTVEK